MSANRVTIGLASASFLLACWVGCQAPQQTARTKPGELPASITNEGAQPRLSATTYFAHGHLLERQGQFERAAAQYFAALKLRPEFITARNRLGITLNKLGKHAEATKEFETAISRHPGSSYLYNNLGFSLYLEGRLTEAEQALQRALELRPTFSRARMNRAIVLAKLGRSDEAFGEFAMVGSEADAYYNLAMIQADAGDYPQAQRSLECALARNPAFEPARLKLAEVADRNALLHPDGIGDAAPRIVMAPTETILESSAPTITAADTTATPAPRPAAIAPTATTVAPTPTRAATAPEPGAAAPTRATPRAEISSAAPAKPGPAVTINPLTPPTVQPKPTPISKPVAVKTARGSTMNVSDVQSTPRPIATTAAPTPPPALRPTAATSGKAVDLTPQVRDVTPGRNRSSVPVAAPRAATPATPRSATIATPAAKATSVTTPQQPATDEQIDIDEELNEDDTESIPLDAIDRLIDAIQRGELLDTIWCELDGVLRGPVRVVGGGSKVQ